MNIQQTYDYLMQIRRTDFLIRRLALRAEELRTCVDAKAIRYDKDRVQPSGPQDRFGEIVARVADLDVEIEQLREEKAALIIEIGDRIEQLGNDVEKTVLTEFYIGRMPMARIAEDIHYSRRQIYNIRRSGVVHLSEILEADPEVRAKIAQIAQTDAI